MCVCAAALGLSAALAPLSDSDLPIHMAVGEWIVRHRAVPYVEPFAWTRAGEPYYAYAWLWQTIFFVTFQRTGAIGLHILAAILGASTVVAGWVAARAQGLRPHAAAVFAVLSGAIALISTPFLRPQLVMHTLVLLSWAAVARIAAPNAATRATFATLLLLGAVAANTQITFPVLAAPLSLLLVAERIEWRKLGVATAALVAGWALSPYVITWPALLARLSKGITMHHPIVGELRPGFDVSPVLGLGLAALPLIAGPRLWRARERWVFGAMWLAGLVTYARYFKGAGPWWWCAIPLCIIALAQLPVPSSGGATRALAALLGAATLASTISDVRLFAALERYEDSAPHGSLPLVKAFVAEPAARWLQRSMRPGVGGKLLTVFSYGSYLRWRLPTISQSIDSRGGIFPDSAILPDVEPGHALGPWTSADLAIVPLDYPVAMVLDADAAWQRVGECELPPWAAPGSKAGLWVRRQWWAGAARPGVAMPADGILRL